MLFRLINAPTTFQRMMNMVLTGLVWELCLVYVDDIIMFSETFEQYMIDLRRCLTGSRLQVLGCTLINVASARRRPSSWAMWCVQTASGQTLIR